MKIFLILLCFFTASLNFAQYKKSEPFAHTFSIVAYDPASDQIGVAVQSHWFSVGSVVSWAEPGIGAVATQSFVNVSFGKRGLALLKQGKSPQETLDQLLSDDEGREFRQVAIVDAKGNVAAFTGKNCVESASHIKGEKFSVQANMMLNDKVVPAMEKAFKDSKDLPLAERLVEAMKAAQNEGGDIRGQQSAAILIVKGKASDKPWEDKIIDLRVEDHPEAVKEIERILKVHRAYEHMNNGDLAIEKGDEELALKEYGSAEEMFPENLEMKYWHAVSLANIGKVDEALPLFKEVFSKDENWRAMTKRIVPNGLLKVDEKTLEKIISVK